MSNNELSKKKKNVQRASYRFDKNVFEEFRTICKENDFSQTKVLEKLMRDFIRGIKNDK